MHRASSACSEYTSVTTDRICAIKNVKPFHMLQIMFHLLFINRYLNHCRMDIWFREKALYCEAEIVVCMLYKFGTYVQTSTKMTQNFVSRILLELPLRWITIINSVFFANIFHSVRFEVFTAMTIKNAVFWDVEPCKYFVNRRFGGTYSLHLQGIKNPRALNQREQVAVDWVTVRVYLPAHVGSSFVDFLYPEDGGDLFLRNVG
jgi:hypothetical protein